jgi:hypothetical protein
MVGIGRAGTGAGTKLLTGTAQKLCGSNSMQKRDLKKNI